MAIVKMVSYVPSGEHIVGETCPDTSLVSSPETNTTVVVNVSRSFGAGYIVIVEYQIIVTKYIIMYENCT